MTLTGNNVTISDNLINNFMCASNVAPEFLAIILYEASEAFTRAARSNLTEAHDCHQNTQSIAINSHLSFQTLYLSL